MFGYMFSPGISTLDASMMVDEGIKNAELRIQSLEMTCAALWSILKEKHGLTDQELIDAIHAVDARDGKINGKFSRADRTCPRCHRKVLTRNPTKCAWCGGDLAPLATG